MHFIISFFYLISIIIIFSLFLSVNESFGHGLGKDTFIQVVGDDDMSITVEGSLSPSKFENPSISPLFQLRAFYTETNETIPLVDLQIKIRHHGEILFDQCFRLIDGLLTVNLEPNKNITLPAFTANGKQIPLLDKSQCISYSKQDHFKLQSEVLSHDGIYDIDILLKNTSQGVYLSHDMMFPLSISIGEIFTFNGQLIKSMENDISKTKNNISVKSYYDSISNFTYDDSLNWISFNMNFNWDPDYFKQVLTLHHELIVEKDDDFSTSNGYIVKFNGIELPSKSVLIDDFSSSNHRIIHIVLDSSQLDQYYRLIENNFKISNTTKYEILTNIKPKFPLNLFSQNNKYLIQLSWDPYEIRPGYESTFIMNIQDPNSGDLIRHSSFNLILIDNDIVIYKQHIKSDFGALSHKFTVPITNSSTIIMLLDNINNQNEKIQYNLAIKTP